ncbi:hypothetical protein CDL12_22771 [Handroanthus impetiginosus]|uniref:Uncharacterized protein n=1 Tax=Handroanthus impetiginosus TaxID=429701 RepID=A0A2G9GHL1_9LAMI|nr:hypothetical protein CDL12_22771 [Handroanthus impetiginosus]
MEFARILTRTQVIFLLFATISLTVHGGRHLHHWEYFDYCAISCRAHSASLTDFGGVGDGTTSNTKAFQTAIDYLSRFESDGGSMLFVPPGKWLTGSFNLTSHFTLYLHKDAVLLATQEESEWAVIEPLPSFGHGRDTEGGRYISLIFGTNLTDVVITVFTVVCFFSYEKGYLSDFQGIMEPLMVRNIQISNLTLVNSPSWHVHPVYSSNVIIQGLTILAPVKIPNTDGINPDSCTNTRIEDCYIVSGDDCIAVKSGWDEYGIAFGMPTRQLVIRRLTCISPSSAVIALGSEMSGGIQDVRAEDILAINSESGVRIKTAVGRGGYVKDIYVRGMTMKTMKWAFWMTGNYGSHADNNYDPNALPIIQNINYRDMIAENVTMAAKLEGIPAKKVPWNCTDIEGISSGVVPQPCDKLPDHGSGHVAACDFPTESLPIDNLEVQTCSYRRKYTLDNGVLKHWYLEMVQK